MNKQQIVTLAVAVGLIVLIMVSMSSLKRPSILDEQCRFRLFRLAGAVNLWLEDHGHSAFPRVINPEPHTGWQPDRTGAAESIFWQYMGGNVRSERRKNETDTQYLERLRDGEMTLCPVSRFEYWYNDGVLRDLAPTALTDGSMKDKIWFFHCQTCADNSAPHQKDKVGGAHYAYVEGEVRTISKSEAKEADQKLAELEKLNARAPGKDMEERIKQQRAWNEALKKRFESGADKVSLNRLTVDIQFEPVK